MIKMALSKTLKIGLIVVIVAAVSIYPAYLLFRPEVPPEETYEYPIWSLSLSGDVSTQTTKTFAELIDGGNTVVEDLAFQTKDGVGTITQYTVTGFPLLTLVSDLGLSLIDFEAIMIIDNTGYNKILTKADMDTGDVNQVVIAYAIDGANNTESGDGYLRMMVNQTIIGGGSGANKAYCIKNVTEVRFLPKWDLEIKVVPAATTNNISYYQLMSSTYNSIRVTDQYFNATKNGGLWQEFTATGLMLWNLTDASHLSLDLTDCDAMNFTADDGYEKKLTISLANLELYFNQIIVTYKYDGEFMLRKAQGSSNNGPIRMAVNQTVVSPSYSYSVSNLRTIEFWDSTP
jgi:hypothetical protein